MSIGIFDNYHEGKVLADVAKAEAYEQRCKNWDCNYMIGKSAMLANSVVCTVQECPVPTQGKCGKKAKTMSYDYDCDCDEDFCSGSGSYISERMNDLRSEKGGALRIQFKLDENKPKSIDEALARIKAGEYQIHDAKFQSTRTYWDPMSFIIWRLPGEEPDQKGFDAAYEAMLKAYSESWDQIRILKSDTAKLAALNAFKAWTFAAA